MVAPYNFGDIQNGLGGEGVLGMVSVHVMGVSSGGDYSPQAYLGTDAAGFRDRYRALRDLVRYRNAVERVLAKLDFHPTLPEESSPDHFSHANHVNRQDAVACVSNLVEQILTIPPVAKGTYR